MGESGVPYCAMFVSWVLHQCGVNFTYAYCPYIERDFRSKTVPKAQARPGDVVLFDWGGDGVADHVGLCEANRGSYLQTIEGNTSSGSGGSQSNGGVVARRTRGFGTIRMVVRLDLAGSAPSTPSQGGASGLGDTRWTGPRMVREWQSQRGTTADGVISGQPRSNKRYLPNVEPSCVQYGPGGSDLVRSVQRLVGSDADGYMGAGTVRALQRWLNAKGFGRVGEDGSYGPATSQAVGRALSAGGFK